MNQPVKRTSDELKRQVEALLFSKGSRMNSEELGKICRIFDKDKLNLILSELQQDYRQMNSSLVVINEGDFWKLTVREQHVPVVKKVVVETELPKTVIETLAVIAYKAPAKQSEIIDIRTNKAYDHIKMLSELGYITTEKFGRTRLLKLSQRFYDYFEVPPDKLKDKLGKFKPFEGEIKDTEQDSLNKEIHFQDLQNKQKSEDQAILDAINALEAVKKKATDTQNNLEEELSKKDNAQL